MLDEGRAQYMQEEACGWDCAVGLGLCGPGEDLSALLVAGGVKWPWLRAAVV